MNVTDCAEDIFDDNNEYYRRASSNFQDVSQVVGRGLSQFC